jgi:cell pole-organizing protein PopZ
VSAQPEAPAQVAQAGTEEAATQRKEEVMAEDTSAKAQENGQEKDLATAVMGAATAAAISAVETSGAMDSRGAATQIGAGRTLETLVCEAMEPHMRAWLDENLAGLVERVVREEVSRLARRLEDD